MSGAHRQGRARAARAVGASGASGTSGVAGASGASGASGVAGAASPASVRRSRINWNAIIAAALILVGLSVLLYPVLATEWNNRMQQQAADAYAKIEQSTPPEVLNKSWEEAHRYNAEAGQVEIIDAWNDVVDESTPEYQRYLNYLSQLAGTEAMGQIAIPAIDSNLPIFHGTSDASLRKGVGHLYGTDLPVGGVDRHAVLSAHTGIPTATLWDNLVDLKVGDVFYIAVAGKKLKYEIHDVSVVLPHESDGLARVAGQDLVTLITCTPYGINSHRLLVTGHQVPMDPAEESVFEETGMRWQWWMWAIVAAAILILLITVRWVWLLRRKSRDEEEQAEEEEQARDEEEQAAAEDVAASDQSGAEG